MSATTAPSTYEIEAVPDSGSTEQSRFHLGSTTAGWACEPTQATAAAWGELAAGLARKIGKLEQRVTIELFRTAPVEGTYVVIPWTKLTRAQTLASEYAGGGKFTKVETSGGAFLDHFLTRSGDEWEKAQEKSVFQAVADWATREQPDNETLRRVNRAVAIAVAARRGAVVNESELP